QPLRARYRRGQRLVRSASSLEAALHAQTCFLAQPDRMRVLNTWQARPRARVVHFNRRSLYEALRLHALARPNRPALPLDLPPQVLGKESGPNLRRAELGRFDRHLEAHAVVAMI